ncbi:MAG: mitofilin family membrane protein [Rhizobiaceae bacterium]
MATSNNNRKKPASSARRGTRAAKTIDLEANKKPSATSKAKPSLGIPDTKAEPKPAAAKSTKAKAEPVKPVPERNSGNFSGMVLSAILGGAVTIGGLGAIGQMNNADGLPLVGSLFAKVGGEKADLSNLADLDAVVSLKSEIAALTARLDSAQEQLKSAGAVDLSAIEGKIAALEQKDAVDASSGIDEETIGRINDLSAKSQANGTQLEQLATQMSELKADLITSGQSADNGDVLAKLSVFEKSIGDVGIQTNVISDRIDKLESQFSSELLGKIEDMAKIADNAKVSEKIARSVAVSALQTSIEQNTPYMNALVSIETLTGPSEETSRLKELAASGKVPDVQTLQSQFKSLASHLIPTTASEANASVLDKLVTSAKSLIKVRSSTPINGTTAQAIVSRIDAKLASGDLAGVVEEWNGLPEESKLIGADWIEGVNMRMETSRLLNIVLKKASEGLRG